VELTDVDSSPLKTKKMKRKVIESEEESTDDHLSETEYESDNQGPSFVPLFSSSKRHRRLDDDALRHYNPEQALFQNDSERVIDENRVLAAAAPLLARRPRERSGSLDRDVSPLHAAKKRRLVETDASDRSRPQDVLKAHQATKPIKPTQPRATSNKALQQVQAKARNGQGIPDVRDIRRAADERAREERERKEHREREERERDKQRERDKRHQHDSRCAIEVDQDPVWPDDYLDKVAQRDADDASGSEPELLQATPKVTRKRKKRTKKGKKTQATEQPSSQEDNNSSEADAPLTQIGAYTPHTQMLLKRMKLNFRERIYTVDPFPSDDLRIQFGEESWKAATEQLNSIFLKG
jgi:hypothetical protein